MEAKSFLYIYTNFLHLSQLCFAIQIPIFQWLRNSANAQIASLGYLWDHEEDKAMSMPFSDYYIWDITKFFMDTSQYMSEGAMWWCWHNLIGRFRAPRF